MLGRDAILRKTMLDECKGERLEEVLAVFSSAVLKKVVAEQQLNNSGESLAVAQSLALEKRGYSGGRTELNTLILAHAVSLRKKLDEKNAARLRYNNLAQLLNSKEEDIAGRVDHVKKNATNDKASKISDRQRTDIRRTVRNNWAGNERWMEALLHGDTYARQDGVLGSPFDRVWRRVRADRLQDLEDQANGLLKQLDDRVRAQQERLSKWQSLQRDMFGEKGTKPTIDSDAHSSPQKGLDFGFGAHESLQLGRLSPRKLSKATPANLGAEYQGLLGSLEKDMRAIDRVSKVPAMPRLGRPTQPPKSPARSEISDKAADEPISELSELEEELAKASAASKDATASTLSMQEPLGSSELEIKGNRSHKPRRPRLPQPLSTMHAFRPKTKNTEISPTEPTRPNSHPRTQAPSPPRRSPIRVPIATTPSPEHSPARSIPPSPTWSPPQNSPPRRTQSPEELPPSPTQQKADQILASMNDASPSPIKQSRPRPTLSLADRTRLSMSRSTTLDFDDDDVEISTGSPTRPRRRNTSSRSPRKKASSNTTPTAILEDGLDVKLNDAVAAEEDDLVARTRKSMANFEAAQQKARLERQRSQKLAAKQASSFARKKYFPAVGEDGGEDTNNSTEVLEELIAKEAENQGAADYESIFKSRPKIKASPPTTPVGRRRFSWDEDDGEA